MPSARKNANPNARKYKNYSEDGMAAAIEAVQNGRMSKNRAAVCYGINRTTLINHIKGTKCKKVGRPTVLNHQEEQLLVHALLKLADWGYGFDRQQLRRCVQDFLRKLDRPNPFRDGLPGVDWCIAFEKRWKQEISRRVAQNLPKNRALAGTHDVMLDFHNKIKELTEKYDLTNKPQNIFNSDETGFQTDAGTQKVLCKRGTRNPTKLVGSVSKGMYTVLMCCNAVGEFLPMFINYKGLHLYSTWCNDGPNNCRYNCSPSGWMEAPQFLDWFINCFIPGTAKLEGKKILILDGHNSHVSIDLIDTAVENNIEILCLPAHTSHIVQPLDVGVFKSVKQSWRNILREFYKDTNYKNVDKLVFPSLMKKLYESGCFSRANAIAGFEGSGIFPLSKNKIMRTTEMASIVEGQQVTPTSSSSSAVDSNDKTDISPKTSLELSLKAVLQTNQRQVPSAVNKRNRISRKFAESLTSKEVQERLRKEAEEKKLKLEKSKQIKKQKRNETASSNKAKKQDKLQPETSSDSEITVTLESEYELNLDSDSTDEDLRSERENQEKIAQKSNSVISPQENSWVLVKYGQQTHYVGQVIKLEKDNHCTIKFLRKRDLFFVFPDVEDILELSNEDIVKTITNPVIRRGKHYFDLKELPSNIVLN